MALMGTVVCMALAREGCVQSRGRGLRLALVREDCVQARGRGLCVLLVREDCVQSRGSGLCVALMRRAGWSHGCYATRDAQAGGDGREDGDGRLEDKLPGLFALG